MLAFKMVINPLTWVLINWCDPRLNLVLLDKNQLALHLSISSSLLAGISILRIQVRISMKHWLFQMSLVNSATTSCQAALWFFSYMHLFISMIHQRFPMKNYFVGRAELVWIFFCPFLFLQSTSRMKEWFRELDWISHERASVVYLNSTAVVLLSYMRRCF